MKELARHIEVLLLENDCVVVPGMGGFVAHYNVATRVDEEGIFLPPTRTIGFNPQLRLNDGLLAQSYSSVYGTNFPEATRRMERDIRALSRTLHEQGEADLPGVGLLRCSIQGTYSFTPYDHLLTTPSLYGLDSFEMAELKASQVPSMKPVTGVAHDTHPAAVTGSAANGADEEKAAQGAGRKVVTLPARTSRHGKRTLTVPFHWVYLAHAAVILVAVTLFFLLSIPIENTQVAGECQAQLQPGALWALMTSEVAVPMPEAEAKKETKRQVPPAAKETTESGPSFTQPKQTTDHGQGGTEGVPSSPQTAVATVGGPTSTATTVTPMANGASSPAAASPVPKPYHVIVASVGTEGYARQLAEQYRQKGYTEAEAIIRDGRNRVCILSFAKAAEAYGALPTVISEVGIEGAWVLKD